MVRRPPRGDTPNWIDEHIPPEMATSTLFRFQIKTPDGMEIDVDLLQDIDVDYERLEEQLEETPAQYVWCTAVLAELKSKVYILERKCKARRGWLTTEAFEAARAGGVRTPPADMVKVMIEADEELNKMEATLALCQKHTNKIHHLADAIRMKSEHLRSLAGFKRQERDAQR